MAMYPEQLMPETVEDLHPLSGLNVQVPKAQPVFQHWSSEFEGDRTSSMVRAERKPMGR